VRFPFVGEPVTAVPRPLVDVVVDGCEQPLLCLVDTGSLRTRLPAWVAEIAGIDLLSAATETILVGGFRTTARHAHVALQIGDMTLPTSAWFCDPWEAPFGLLGQEDVLSALRFTCCARGQWFKLDPEPGG
jgi:hypothetical protein